MKKEKKRGGKMRQRTGSEDGGSAEEREKEGNLNVEMGKSNEEG